MTDIRASFIALPALVGLLACQGGPSDDAAAAPDLVGTWRLVSWQVTDAEGQTTYPFGPNPQGQIVYTETKQMSAQIMNPERRVEDVSGSDENDVIGRVARTFFAYYGTYSVDAAAGTVTRSRSPSSRELVDSRPARHT